MPETPKKIGCSIIRRIQKLPIPISIARSEMLPRIRRDSRYLQRETLEIVSGGDEGARIYAPTPNNLTRVATGSLRLRQRPGAQNALGPAKFLFPNVHNVYLHGTPARSLFSSVRRDFSRLASAPVNWNWSAPLWQPRNA